MNKFLLIMKSNMKYGIILANPKEYYNEVHRMAHFIKFTRYEED
jgi:hypothetical protein